MLPLTSSTRPLTIAAGSGQMMGSQLGGAPVHWPPSTHCLTVRVQSDNQHSSSSAYLVLFPERRNPWWQTTMTDEPYLNDFLLAETWTRPLSGETGTLQFISAMNVCLNTDHSTYQHLISPTQVGSTPCPQLPSWHRHSRSPTNVNPSLHLNFAVVLFSIDIIALISF